MAVNKILFKGLPFRPDRNQVFYIENGYDGEANSFIRSNYIDLKSMFRHIGMEFYYLPYLLREQDVEAKVRYYAPYLSPKLLVQKVRSNALVPYISDPEVRATLKPSFLFEGRREGRHGDVGFLTIDFESIKNSDDAAIEQLMHIVVSAREASSAEEEERRRQELHRFEAESYSMHSNYAEDMACEMPIPYSSPAHDSDNASVQECGTAEEHKSRRQRKKQGPSKGILGNFIIHCIKDPTPHDDEYDKEDVPRKSREKLEEEQSLIETAKVLSELRMTVQKLRLEGVSLMAIHEFIDKQEPLSRMTITPDYRIILPDYNNMEIEMGALPKAIYFLYLRYPEGIIYKHLQDYFSELLNIYKQLRPNTDEARLYLTITKVVNPLGNALNENIARVRKAFIEKFDEHLANNYIITGERGMQYSIQLDRSLITWEE